jgi:hypothetical protein
MIDKLPLNYKRKRCQAYEKLGQVTMEGVGSPYCSSAPHLSLNVGPPLNELLGRVVAADDGGRHQRRLLGRPRVVSVEDAKNLVTLTPGKK